MRPGIFLEQNSMVIRLTDDDGLSGVKNKITGALINAATVQATLLNLDMTPAAGVTWPVLLTEQPSLSAIYQGVVPVPTPVDEWAALDQFKLKISFQGAGSGEAAMWLVPVTVITRTE